MDKDLRICYAFLEIEDISLTTPLSIRGYFGNSFIEEVEYHHHHHTENSFVYRYPHIQYKTIFEKFLIIGLREYSYDIPLRLAKVNHIKTKDGKKIKINNIKFETKKMSIYQKEGIYSFYSPWIALNSNNFKRFFSDRHITSKTKFLEEILTGNILSMYKGLGIYIDFKINVKIYQVKPLTIILKGNQFIAFKSCFKTNILIPKFLGLGKSVSKGFGTVSLTEDDN